MATLHMYSLPNSNDSNSTAEFCFLWTHRLEHSDISTAQFVSQTSAKANLMQLVEKCLIARS